MKTKIELLFASQNKNKVHEIQSALQGKFVIKSLLDINHYQELDEPYDTFEENAKTKAKQGYDIFRMPCFAEDAGLVIQALGGRPGVLSARYAGTQKDPQANIDKVLTEMKGIEDRSAYFIACIAYFSGSDYKLFEGRIYGEILQDRYGEKGFGYDPIFRPDGYDHSFGELSDQIKSSVSHRTIAMNQFVNWLLMK